MASQKQPFENISNEVEIINKVKQGVRLEFDQNAIPEYVQITENAWSHHPEHRPSADSIIQSLGKIYIREKLQTSHEDEDLLHPRKKNKNI